METRVDTKNSALNPRHGERIEEGLFVEINGVSQWMTLRGADRRNPVLLILASLSRMAPFFAPWEQEFTLVQWDQPGIGATQAKNGDAGTGPLSLERLANDAIAVAEFVRNRLCVEKIAGLGISGGSLIGLKIIKQRPELFSAYVGSGQGVNWLRQEQMGYSIVLEQARLAGNQNAIKELEAIGAPPYLNAADDMLKSKYCGALTAAEQAYIAGLDPQIMAAVRNPPPGSTWIAPGLPLGDPRATSLAAYEKLRGEIFAFDARRLGLTFEVPMFFFQGEQDLYTVTSEVMTYAAEISAPQKLFAAIPGGGHSAFFLRDAFLALLTRHVRPVAARTA
jgi:pimeloyl-ACP methyl ester carboxylesterase